LLKKVYYYNFISVQENAIRILLNYVGMLSSEMFALVSNAAKLSNSGF